MCIINNNLFNQYFLCERHWGHKHMRPILDSFIDDEWIFDIEWFKNASKSDQIKMLAKTYWLDFDKLKEALWKNNPLNDYISQNHKTRIIPPFWLAITFYHSIQKTNQSRMNYDAFLDYLPWEYQLVKLKFRNTSAVDAVISA